MRIVVSNDEETINVANELINAVSGHGMRIGTAKIDAILSCKVSASRFIEEGIVVHLAVISLEDVMRDVVSFGIGNASGSRWIFIIVRWEKRLKRVFGKGEGSGTLGGGLG